MPFPDTDNRTMLCVDYAGTKLNISARIKSVNDSLIVFLHGLGCAKESFDLAFTSPSLNDLSLCTFDFPGHGSSGALDQSSYSLHSYAEITNLLIEQLAPQHLVLVGHSMGGAVGLLAAELTQEPACFINVEGNLVAQDCGIVSRKIAAQPLSMFAAKGFSEFHTELQGSTQADLQAWARWYAACDPTAIHEIARSLVQWSDSGQLLTLFTNLTNKAYIHGHPTGRLDHLPSVLRGIPTYKVKDTEHFPMLDNPTDFYSLIATITAHTTKP